MNWPVYTKEPSIRYPEYTEELDTPLQTYVPTAKRKKIKNQEIILFDNEEKLRIAKGIINALILCIPFWTLVITFFVWLI
jgi:hypothetical protein